MNQALNTIAAALSHGDTIIERYDTGGVSKRIEVTSLKTGSNACSRTKVHVNDSMCYDSSQPLEVDFGVKETIE